jgi:threonine/homoserine efflux transporter RhtA
MKNDLSKTQRLVFKLAGVIAMIGIYVFMNTRTDMSDSFAIGVYFACCAGIIWALRKFARSNIS